MNGVALATTGWRDRPRPFAWPPGGRVQFLSHSTGALSFSTSKVSSPTTSGPIAKTADKDEPSYASLRDPAVIARAACPVISTSEYFKAHKIESALNQALNVLAQSPPVGAPWQLLVCRPSSL